MPRKYRKTKRRKSSDGSWKKLKKRFHLQKRLRRFGLALLVFSSVILTLGAVYAWYCFSQPFASAAETFGTTFSWDGREPLNLLWLEAEYQSVLGEAGDPVADKSANSNNTRTSGFSRDPIADESAISSPESETAPLANLAVVSSPG